MIPERLAEEVRAIYRADPAHAEKIIEHYLEERLANLKPGERNATIEKMLSLFAPGKAVKQAPASTTNREVWQEIVTLLTGRPATPMDFDSPEFINQLATTLSTLFTCINEITETINTTLTGNQQQLETIRQVIGNSINGTKEPLEQYLSNIREAFLISHKAFQTAASNLIRKVLAEFDPAAVAAETSGGLKFGPMRKAECYEIMVTRYQRLETWLQSDRFREELLREFEKNCRNLLAESGLAIT